MNERGNDLVAMIMYSYTLPIYIIQCTFSYTQSTAVYNLVIQALYSRMQINLNVKYLTQLIIHNI